MKKILFLAIMASGLSNGYAQTDSDKEDTSWKQVFRESHPKTTSLVHTKLDVRFDFDKTYLYGKEWLTLQPFCYATDSVVLDAKGMEFKEVSLMTGTVKKPLKYTYDGWQVHIKLDKTYKPSNNYVLYFDYISKPNELKSKGSAAITDAKGLYFINPKGTEKNKPTEIWTQGETEANSAWMVTIDKPNQKTTEEISMTVPSKYVTLSNGLLKSSKTNTDGTRTDYWKMDLPHAPYLFFMGVGDFSIVKDSYKGKEVSYYVEKEYASVARKIFGNTPEMMQFFSTRLGVEYPWAKYAQFVGRDYVSGAMENTTATIHQETVYQNARQLTEGNIWEETIAHELFHHWFGDLVTAESWSHLTVNESFANYSEYLWDEYKHGKDAADEHNFNDMQGYLLSGSEGKDLVRFHYADKEEMFDAVSYNKGGRILHMLRNYVGDDAFFKSLQVYLTNNKFKTGEAAQLRLAFEEVTGQDLNWFWNQWYYSNGHPELKISYNYDRAGYATVLIEQTQKSDKIFRLPIAVDIYEGSKKTRHKIWIEHRMDSFYFPISQKPELINVDADKILLAVKTDAKTAEQYMVQYNKAGSYMDRKEALDYFAKNKMPELSKGLTDVYEPLKAATIQQMSMMPNKEDAAILKQIENIATTDNNKKTRAAAIKYLSKTKRPEYLPVYKSNINDSSYAVAGASLEGIAVLDTANAYTLAQKYSNDARGELGIQVNKILIKNGNESDFDFIVKSYGDMPPSFDKIKATGAFCDYLTRINDTQKVKKGIDEVMQFRNLIPEAYRAQTDPAFRSSLDKLGKAKGKETQDYIDAAFK